MPGLGGSGECRRCKDSPRPTSGPIDGHAAMLCRRVWALTYAWKSLGCELCPQLAFTVTRTENTGQLTRPRSSATLSPLVPHTSRHLLVAMALGTPAVVCVCILGAYVFLRLLLQFTQHAQEPPVIEASIPFLTPLVGMIREKSEYHLRLRFVLVTFTRPILLLTGALRDTHQLPIYTLRLPFSRMYIVNATDLIPELQKHWRTVSFAAIAADAGTAVGMSKEAVKIMHDDLMSEHGFNLSWPKHVMSAMGPGKDLDAIDRRAIEVIAGDMEALRAGAAVKVGLWQWTREIMNKSTSEAVWGPQNPYRDAAVAEAWR